MISYIHLPIIIMSSFQLMFMRRWWLCIDRMGYTKEVARRAPSLIQRDMIAATFAFMTFVLAAADWLGVTLPGQSAPTPSTAMAIMSIACVCISMFILKNTSERFAGNWAGTRESALRTIAALHIIDAANLSYALQYVQELDTENNNQIIDVTALREVGK